jgi:hypothetical protein
MRQVSLFPGLERPDPVQDRGRKVKKKPVQTPAADDSPTAYTADFEEFWKAYPRKDGKAAAFLSYRRCRSKGCKAGLMLIRAQQFAESDAGMNEVAFIPHASTWLNQLRFLDDPAAWNSSGVNGHKRPDNAEVDWNYKD